MKKRRGKWRDIMKVATPVTVICGIVAVVYFFYRAALIAVPAVAFEQSLLHPMGNPAIVCGAEGDDNLQDPSPLISKKYQTLIASQPLTPNMVANPTMDQLDPVSGLPIGYSQNTNADTTDFEYLRDAADKQLFLRAINKVEGSHETPTWLTDPVAIKDDRTYAYSFMYRSDIPIRVSIERAKDGKTSYQQIVMLHPAPTWQRFTAHFHNAADASSLRVLLSGDGGGYVDSRAYDIHQIQDANLMGGGIVTISFDDGWKSVTDHALPLLQKYNIRSTQYIISEVAENNIQEYMDISGVARLKKAGHEIGSHSLRHCNQTTLPDAELEDNATRSKTILEGKGLGPIRSFAYPLGQYNEKTQAVYGHAYPLIRTSDFGFNDRYFDAEDIRSIGVMSSTSDREFKSWLEYAKKHRLWVVLVYHRIDETGNYSVTHEQLDRQLSMVASSGLRVLPLSEAASAIRK